MRYALLGLIFGLMLHAELARKAEAGFTLAASNGELVIAQIKPGLNAARDGLKAGDAILRVNGAPAAAEAAFARTILRRNAGERVEFVVRRDGSEMKVPV